MGMITMKLTHMFNLKAFKDFGITLKNSVDDFWEAVTDITGVTHIGGSRPPQYALVPVKSTQTRHPISRL